VTAKTFKELEHGGWMDKAGAYDSYFALVTNQAIDAILDSFGTVQGKRLLDVGCGTGHLAANAAQRGAEAEGIDFASAMVATAAANYPKVQFIKGDAEDLPYEDERFDCVACSFGLLHMQHPEQVMKEAYRVLRKGGRFTFTVWCTPEQGSEFFGLVQAAIQAHGTLDVGLPPAPPFFRFANAEECHKTLAGVGFTFVATSKIPLTWRGNTSQDLLDLLYKSVVRTPMVLERQTTEARKRIHNAILTGAERYRVGAEIAIPIPALLVTATKP
jgi:ubiquinone/menaquinone biosynthesis C-methylase UbiE